MVTTISIFDDFRMMVDGIYWLSRVGYIISCSESNFPSQKAEKTKIMWMKYSLFRLLNRILIDKMRFTVVCVCVCVGNTSGPCTLHTWDPAARITCITHETHNFQTKHSHEKYVHRDGKVKAAVKRETINVRRAWNYTDNFRCCWISHRTQPNREV